jgi:hypothetical protein
MVKHVSGDIPNPDDGARTIQQVTSPPTHQSNEDNTNVYSAAFLKGSKATSTSPGANGGLIASKSPATELGIGARKQRPLGRPALRPKPGRQVCKMAPGYSFLRGTRFDKNIRKERKQLMASKSKDSPDYITEDLDAEREMYQLHQLQDRTGLKRHFDDI